jgi:hypothetical protein
VDDQRHVVFAGTTVSEPSVDTIRLQFPDHMSASPVLRFRHRPGVWMSFPEPFPEGQTIRVSWLACEQVYHEENSAPLIWEPLEISSERSSTKRPASRGPAANEIIEAGFTVTHYAYIEDDSNDTQIS